MIGKPTDFKAGLDLLMAQAQMIAMLPVEEWMSELEGMDTIAPMIDPTAYRDFLRSGRREPMLEVFDAFCRVKAAALKWNAGVKAGSIR